MKEAEVRKRAFAMALTSPAYPRGPYRFFHREYLIIAYRTDPDVLRALVPEPLGSRADRQIRIHPHAGFDRLRRLHRNRPSNPGFVPRPQGRLYALHVLKRRSADSRRARALGDSPRNWLSPACAPRSTRWSARSIMVRCGSPPAPWATSTLPPIAPPSRPRSRRPISFSRSSHMSTAVRGSASWSNIILRMQITYLKRLLKSHGFRKITI